MSFLQIEAQQACYALVEQAINHFLELDPDYLQKLSPLYGSVIKVELLGLGLSLFLRTDKKGIICQGEFDGDPDCVIKGTPIGLMKMSLGDSASQTKGMFAGDVEISGDIQLGQKMNRVLDSIEIDWEEHLSHITGDVVAYRVGQAAKQGFDWLKQSSQQMSENIREYFIYESDDLPQPSEVNRFVSYVDTLRDDVARAEARIQNIHSKLEQNNVN